MKKSVRLLIVDDSPLIRRMMGERLSRYEQIQVIGTAKDAYEARDKIVAMKPDVITLDLEMPRMNGAEFIGILMKHWPLPIVVVSGFLGDSATRKKVLAAGAAELFAKPTVMDDHCFSELVELIVNAKAGRSKSTITLGSAVLLQPHPTVSSVNKILVIGASTGGTEAIREVLTHLPAGMPGIVMVQHMPAGFTASFAERLDMLCPHLSVKEAQNGDEVLPGTVLLAPGDFQMSLKRRPGGYSVEVKTGELVNRHKPSVDVIFESAAKIAGANAIGVILTGMGADGAKGLLSMKQARAKTIAQDENSSVVFGMPKEAIALGAADQVVPLDQVADAIVRLL